MDRQHSRAAWSSCFTQSRLHPLAIACRGRRDQARPEVVPDVVPDVVPPEVVPVELPVEFPEASCWSWATMVALSGWLTSRDVWLSRKTSVALGVAFR